MLDDSTLPTAKSNNQTKNNLGLLKSFKSKSLSKISSASNWLNQKFDNNINTSSSPAKETKDADHYTTINELNVAKVEPVSKDELKCPTIININ